MCESYTRWHADNCTTQRSAGFRLERLSNIVLFIPADNMLALYPVSTIESTLARNQKPKLKS